jgi:hypothetical protein
VAAFGALAPDDVLYHAVSEEHWLPLFHGGLETLVCGLVCGRYVRV